MNDLIHETHNNMLWITFNRPDARNAITFEMYDKLGELCKDATSDSSIKAIIITGIGNYAFSSGTDITQYKNLENKTDPIKYEKRIETVLETIERCPLPTVASINGVCTGMGVMIAAVCDIRIAVNDARFGFPFPLRLGSCISALNLARLTALIGSGRTREFIFSARFMHAEEAKDIGLISEISHTMAAMKAESESMARHLSQMAPLTIQATKEAMHRNLVASTVDDSDLFELCFLSKDFQNGLEAFIAKEKPNWSGT